MHMLHTALQAMLCTVVHRSSQTPHVSFFIALFSFSSACTHKGPYWKWYFGFIVTFLTFCTCCLISVFFILIHNKYNFKSSMFQLHSVWICHTQIRLYDGIDKNLWTCAVSLLPILNSPLMDCISSDCKADGSRQFFFFFMIFICYFMTTFTSVKELMFEMQNIVRVHTSLTQRYWRVMSEYLKPYGACRW